MTSVMIYPDLSSEKAIANYSIKLVESINKNSFDIKSETYLAGNSFSLIRKLSKIRRNYKNIHVQHEYNLLGGFGLPFFLVIPYLGFSKKNNLFVTMHTVLSQKEKFKGGKIKTLMRKKLYLFQNAVISKFSKKVIVHAEFFKKILVDEYGFNSQKIEVIPQGIIEGIKTSSRESARRELGLSGNVFLIIGGFVPDHGADTIIKQADKIGKTILIVTNPNPVNDRNKNRVRDYLDYNLSIVKERKLDKYVRFDLKEIPFDLWWKYYAAADLVLLPYLGGIGSGIFSDAIAMKIPMVGSNIPYFREYSKKFGFIKIAKEDDYAAVIHNSLKKKNYLEMKKDFEKYIRKYGLNSLGTIYKKMYLEN